MPSNNHPRGCTSAASHRGRNLPFALPAAGACSPAGYAAIVGPVPVSKYQYLLYVVMANMGSNLCLSVVAVHAQHFVALCLGEGSFFRARLKSRCHPPAAWHRARTATWRALPLSCDMCSIMLRSFLMRAPGEIRKRSPLMVTWRINKAHIAGRQYRKMPRRVCCPSDRRIPIRFNLLRWLFRQ